MTVVILISNTPFRLPGRTDAEPESRYCIIPGLVTETDPGDVANCRQLQFAVAL